MTREAAEKLAARMKAAGIKVKIVYAGQGEWAVRLPKEEPK